MSLDLFTLVHPTRVRWAEADMQRVVFNAHYLAYFDLGVTEYWRAVSQGDSAWLMQTFERIYVVKSTIEFHASARFDDELGIAVRCVRLGRSSMTFDCEIHRNSDHLISGQNVYVHADGGKASPIPDDLRARIHAFERVAPS